MKKRPPMLATTVLNRRCFVFGKIESVVQSKAHAARIFNPLTPHFQIPLNCHTGRPDATVAAPKIRALIRRVAARAFFM